MPLPEWLETIEHTADEGISVRAPTRELLFERAALGMFMTIADIERVRQTLDQEVELEAADPEELLVSWLSELNVRHQVNHTLFSQFELLECTETALKARVRGEPIDPSRHEIYTEIKAVTFCGLDLGRTAEGWHARVIFDV